MKTCKWKSNISIALCLLLTVIILTGCWDIRDINHRTLPIVLGISTDEEGKYKVFLKIPEPVEDKVEVKIVSGTGETISHAIDAISRNMESTIDLLHVKVIMIERKTAEEGMKDIIAGFIRSREVSPKALITICDQNLDEFFSILSTSKNLQGTNMFEFFEKNAGWNPEIALTRIWEVYRSIHSYTRDVAIPMIATGETTSYRQTGSAVIKNGKMVEQISNDETLLFNAFNNESTHGQIEVLNHASVMITANSMDHYIEFKNNQPYLKSRVKLRVVLLETRGKTTDAMIKKELRRMLTSRFNDMLAKLQKSEADILGLGQLYRTKISRKDLKNWRSVYYPTLKSDIQFDIDIQNEGYLKTI
ncbi:MULTISPECIES: Ger(x)C family spore germination protein [unclassified Cytobacillus]|uniref:Ger(x)C family spore germination protein n=1 Tax=unclassified Cytobacillus TaxID=2675268 RepID=UPI00203A9F1A|nr:Ger(x)C family spore germination protein [Cytobacillus sp. AMY 15.2]MCM3090852.1 Ger(x)C family spore germination protein [Cytobacillus sp. AMY 15.2]